MDDRRLQGYSAGLRAAAAAHASPGGTVRVAVMSDIHVAGPEYPLNGENGELDNHSITRTQQRLWRAVRAVNAMQPRPQVVLFGGDIVHNGMHYLASLGPHGLHRLFHEINGFRIAASILSDLEAKPVFAWGNHDRLTQCANTSASASNELTAHVYRHFFHAPPYSAHDVGGWKVVAANSMLGPTWDPTHPRCNTTLSSYGEEQLRWLDEQLLEGKPTLVLTHFPLPLTVRNEVPGGGRVRDLPSVLAAHSNVRLSLSGHFHKGVDWGAAYPFPARTLPGLRYSPQNFFVLDLLPNGSIVGVDAAKNRGGSRCSDWWSYAGAPRREGAAQPRDSGDCGWPGAGEEGDVRLHPVLNRSAIPSPDVINPERSCRFELAPSLALEACAGGATADCCDVLEQQFWPSSSAPFVACLCQPAFWQRAVAFLAQHGVDLPSVLRQCTAEHGRTILYRGGPLTWCPAAEDGLAAVAT